MACELHPRVPLLLVGLEERRPLDDIPQLAPSGGLQQKTQHGETPDLTLNTEHKHSQTQFLSVGHEIRADNSKRVAVVRFDCLQGSAHNNPAIIFPI